ncbi:hypothetical protein Q7P37_004382 [Cladosporium fusiforme]
MHHVFDTPLSDLYTAPDIDNALTARACPHPNPHPPPTPQPTTPLSTLWWNTNLPPHNKPPPSPSYLTYAQHHAKERANLSTRDENFTRQPWATVRANVAANRLDRFTRVPSELRRYRLYTEKLVREHGSVMRFVLDERLGWGDERAGEGRFADGENYRILHNDWPYGIDTRIVHLVVWTKFALAADAATDDLLPEARAEIDAFVRRVFVGVCGEQNVLWFRNWGALKSVHAVEHFHVMLFEPPGGLWRA